MQYIGKNISPESEEIRADKNTEDNAENPGGTVTGNDETGNKNETAFCRQTAIGSMPKDAYCDGLPDRNVLPYDWEASDEAIFAQLTRLEQLKVYELERRFKPVSESMTRAGLFIKPHILRRAVQGALKNRRDAMKPLLEIVKAPYLDPLDDSWVAEAFEKVDAKLDRSALFFAARGRSSATDCVLDYREADRWYRKFQRLRDCVEGSPDERFHPLWNPFENIEGSCRPEFQPEPGEYPTNEQFIDVCMSLATPERGNATIACSLVEADVGIWAALSGDTQLNAALSQPEDFHHLDAARLFGVPVGSVNSCQCESAKELWRRLTEVDTDLNEANIRRLLEPYPDLGKWLRTQIWRASDADTRSVYSPVSGRMLFLPFGSEEQDLRLHYLLNYPVDAARADVLREAAIRLHELGIRLIGCNLEAIHVEVPKEDYEAVAHTMRSTLEQVFAEVFPACRIRAMTQVRLRP